MGERGGWGRRIKFIQFTRVSLVSRRHSSRLEILSRSISMNEFEFLSLLDSVPIFLLFLLFFSFNLLLRLLNIRQVEQQMNEIEKHLSDTNKMFELVPPPPPPPHLSQTNSTFLLLFKDMSKIKSNVQL